MKIRIRDIREEGLDLEEVLKAKDIGLTNEDISCVSDLHVTAHFDKVELGILGQIGVRGEFSMTCSRCLETIVSEREEDIELFIETTPTDEYVDVGEDIRQEMIIAVSKFDLCREDCKGLCKGCGANLNNEACKCIDKDK